MRRPLECLAGLAIVALIGIVLWVDVQVDPTYDELELWMDRR